MINTLNRGGQRAARPAKGIPNQITGYVYNKQSQMPISSGSNKNMFDLICRNLSKEKIQSYFVRYKILFLDAEAGEDSGLYIDFNSDDIAFVCLNPSTAGISTREIKLAIKKQELIDFIENGKEFDELNKLPAVLQSEFIRIFKKNDQSALDILNVIRAELLINGNTEKLFLLVEDLEKVLLKDKTNVYKDQC